MYNRTVDFEWDPNKAEENLRKHGVSFSTEGVAVFSDDYAVTVSDEESDPNERRFITLGLGGKGRVLVVAYCYRGDRIRLISARQANAGESRQYQEQR
jgi:uncharacterized DUF497 family protein